jgi:hypothetical protein
MIPLPESHPLGNCQASGLDGANLGTLFPYPTVLGSLDNNALASKRVFSGVAGSGRTRFLLAAEAADIAGGAVSPFRNVPPSPLTHTLNDLAPSGTRQFDHERYWQAIWRLCIQVALASHLMQVGKDDKTRRLRVALDAFGAVGSAAEDRVIHPFTALLYIKNAARTNRLGFTSDPALQTLEDVLLECIEGQAPVVLHFDGLDDGTDTNPHIHFESQTGLLLETLRVSRIERLNKMLRLRLGVRHSVTARLQAKQTNLAGHTGIASLDWTPLDSFYFLGACLREVDGISKFSETDDPIADITGLSEVEIVERKSFEAVSHYVIRHLSFSPRDCINIGNKLIVVAKRAIENDASSISAPVLKEIVSQHANVIGRELLIQVCNELDAGSSDLGSKSGDSTERRIFRELKSWIQTLEFDRFSRAELLDSVNTWPRADLQGVFLDALWRHRVIGAVSKVDGSSHVTYAQDGFEVFPFNPIEFALHPSMTEVASIKAFTMAPSVW